MPRVRRNLLSAGMSVPCVLARQVTVGEAYASAAESSKPRDLARMSTYEYLWCISDAI